MDAFKFIVTIVAILFFSFTSYMKGFDSGDKRTYKKQSHCQTVYKRCLDSDIYNEFQCYNMIIKGE